MLQNSSIYLRDDYNEKNMYGAKLNASSGIYVRFLLFESQEERLDWLYVFTANSQGFSSFSEKIPFSSEWSDRTILKDLFSGPRESIQSIFSICG